MNKESTTYFDTFNQEVFVGDRFFDGHWNQMFTVGFNRVESQGRTQYYLLSDDRKINLGIGAVGGMTPIKESQKYDGNLEYAI